MRLISQLDRAAGPVMQASSPANRRTQNRIPFHREVRLLCEFKSTRERPAQYLVRCRNISKRGLAFLHAKSIEEGTRCELTVIGSEHEAYEITGTIMRSHPIAESAFEVGVRFGHAVDLSHLVAPRSSDGVIPLPALRPEVSKRAAI